MVEIRGKKLDRARQQWEESKRRLEAGDAETGGMTTTSGGDDGAKRRRISRHPMDEAMTATRDTGADAQQRYRDLQTCFAHKSLYGVEWLSGLDGCELRAG